MSSQNQLSRYGAISRSIPELAPSAKVFLVGDSDDTTYGIENLAAIYPPDLDGVVRVFSTIQGAVNAASANRGDVVLVAPNHNEGLSRADCWNVAGIQIIGMGQGDRRPVITYNDSGATINIGADGIRVSNLMFLASVDSIGIGVDMDTGFFGQRLDNCIFTVDAATDNFTTMLRVGAKESLIDGNRFLAADTAGAGSAIRLMFGDPDNTIIRGNYIYGQFDSTNASADTKNNSPAPITIDTTDTGDTNLSGIIIEENVIINTDTAASLMMRFNPGTLFVRGLARNNYFASFDSATADTSKFSIGIAANTGLRMINNFLASADTDALEKRINDSFVELV